MSARAQKAPCSVEGCDRPSRAKGMCSAHYQRDWIHGDPAVGGPLEPRRDRSTAPTCSVHQCNDGREGHGLCSKHYKRAKRYGILDQYSASDETSAEPLRPGREIHTRRLTSAQVERIEATLDALGRGRIPLLTVGFDLDVEEQATRLLMEDRKLTGGWHHSDWLTDWQLKLRQDREVYNRNGFPDPNIREGRLFRAYNPLIGTRPQRLQSV